MKKPQESFMISAEECANWSTQYQKRAFELYDKGTLTNEEEEEYKKSLFLAGLLEEVTDQMDEQLADLDDDVSPEELN
jgi:hypothetical protein